MVLEDKVLGVLKAAMQDRLGEVDKNALRDPEVKDVLTAYFSEMEVRPEVVSAIRAPTLMWEYLRLNLEERIELENLREIHTHFLNGEIEESNKIVKLNMKPVNLLARKISYANTLVCFFNTFLKERKPYDLFNYNYLLNKKVNRKLGMRLLSNAGRIFAEKGGFSNLIHLATEINPAICNYTSLKNVLLIDGPLEALSYFDKFLKERKNYDVFSKTYIEKHCGRSGNRLHQNAQKKLASMGGIQYLIDNAATTHSEIKRYLTRKSALQHDGSRMILGFFEKFIKERKLYDIFTKGFIGKHCGKHGRILYSRAERNLNVEGGLNYIIAIIAKGHVDIDKYSTFKNVIMHDGQIEIINFFDKFLKERESNSRFNSNYIIRHCGKAGGNLLANIRYNLSKEGGINYMVQLAAQQRPEILEHWSYKPRKSSARRSA